MERWWILVMWLNEGTVAVRFSAINEHDRDTLIAEADDMNHAAEVVGRYFVVPEAELPLFGLERYMQQEEPTHD